MTASLFKATSSPVDLLVNNIDHGSLGLPEIQRPFVWTNAQVRDLFDSMFKGYPVGFLLFWSSSDAQGAKQIGDKRHGTDMPSLLIIDGQQRLTSLYAVMKGIPVLDKNFQKRTIKIAFHPEKGEFAVYTAVIARDSEWISNISSLFDSSTSNYKFITEFLEKLKSVHGEISAEREDIITSNITQLFNIKNYTFSSLEINKETDEELVADIFVRVNSGGQKLNQANFILTLMSVFWDEGRHALEEFCKHSRIPNTTGTTSYNYFIQPDPDDIIRVPIVLAFQRARLKYGYQVLRGKDLDSGEVTAERRDEQFEKFKDAQEKALNIQNWKDFLICLYLAGYRSEKMIMSKMAVVYSYSLFLIAKYQYSLSGDTLKNLIAKWFFMTSLTSRYSGSPESQMEADIADLRNIHTADEFVAHIEKIINDSLTEDFWKITLPNNLATSSARSPSLFAYYSSLALLDAKVLFSNLKVSDMLDPTMKAHREALEKHHLFPKAYLANNGYPHDRERNQIANYALIEWDRNNIISDDAPHDYFSKQIANQANSPSLQESLRLHALPQGWEHMEYVDFLIERRQLMAQIIREGFAKLCE